MATDPNLAMMMALSQKPSALDKAGDINAINSPDNAKYIDPGLYMAWMKERDPDKKAMLFEMMRLSAANARQAEQEAKLQGGLASQPGGSSSGSAKPGESRFGPKNLAWDWWENWNSQGGIG